MIESEYSVCMKLYSKILLGVVVGVGLEGSNKNRIESKYGCKVEPNYKEATIKIVGMDEVKVKKSQKMALDFLSKCTFSANIHADLSRKIVGRSGDTIKNIRESTGAHIKIIEKVGEEKKLVIYGKRSEFELAKEMVMDIIESEVASQFHSQPSMCFRDKTVEKGFQKAKYVAGQVSPTPRSLYLEFEAVLNSDETKLVQSNAEPLNLKCISPLAIRKNRAVLAPFQEDYYRARVLSYTRDDNGVGIYVDFVDFGNSCSFSLAYCIS